MVSFKKLPRIFFLGLQLVLIFSTLPYFAYDYFVGSYSHRFRYAEVRQGELKSDFIFSVLGWQYPNNSNVLHERSVAFNKRGMYSCGFRFLDSAVNIDPVSHLGYRGWIKLYMLRDYNGALRDFNQLDPLTKDHVDYPMSENIHFLKAICYDKLGNYESAIKYFDIARTSSLKGFVDYKINLYKAIVLFNNHRGLEAATLLLEVLNDYPKCSEANYYLARIYGNSSQTQKEIYYLNLARNYYLRGYRVKNSYNEMPYEIHLEEIDSLIHRNMEKSL